MANKRMFTRELLESDKFLELSHNAKVLYFYLNLAADNEGFVNSKQRVMRLCDCSDTDLQELIKGNWVIPFDTGVLVITHWRMHNTLKNDRCNSIYEREKQLLECINKTYFLVETDWKESGNSLEKIGVERRGKEERKNREEKRTNTRGRKKGRYRRGRKL